MGLLADIQKLSPDTMALAQANGLVASAALAAAAAGDTVVADQAAVVADLTALGGPAFDPTPNADGSLNVYALTSPDTPPGFSITVIKPAS